MAGGIVHLRRPGDHRRTSTVAGPADTPAPPPISDSPIFPPCTASSRQNPSEGRGHALTMGVGGTVGPTPLLRGPLRRPTTHSRPDRAARAPACPFPGWPTVTHGHSCHLSPRPTAHNDSSTHQPADRSIDRDAQVIPTSPIHTRHDVTHGADPRASTTTPPAHNRRPAVSTRVTPTTLHKSHFPCSVFTTGMTRTPAGP
jgi:hypothetical protein